MKSSLLPVSSLLALLLLLSGCVSSDLKYVPPKAAAVAAQNFKEVDRPKDEIWSALVAGLGSQFFVINNMDKASGFINVSYSGDPEKYVDGGELYFKVENIRGLREYRFPASRENVQYEVFNSGILMGVSRRLSLDGRMNVIVTESSSGRTRVTVNTRYVLTLNASGQNAMGQPMMPQTETISFNTGGEAKLSSGTTFRPTGEFEMAVLALVNERKGLPGGL